MVNILFNIGKKIINLRIYKEISQKELAYRANMSQSFISHLERDKRNPTINTLYKISKGFNIPFKDFLLYLINEYDREEIISDD